MDRLEFIEKVFTLYRVNTEKSRDLIFVYDEAFTTNKPVDWDRFYKFVANTAEGNLPKPGWFISKFDNFLLQGNTATADGIRVKVTLTDGYSYEYETYCNSLSFDEIKRRFMKKFRDKFSAMYLMEETEKKFNWVRY